MRRLNERHVVVLVDDEPAVLSALARSLRKEPYQVLATQEPQEALRWVQSRDVSAVVSDQRMYKMSGTELLALVGQISPGTARIILTAYAGPTAGTPRLKQSIECMIEKPWDDAMLRRTLREFLSEREWDEAPR